LIIVLMIIVLVIIVLVIIVSAILSWPARADRSVADWTEAADGFSGMIRAAQIMVAQVLLALKGRMPASGATASSAARATRQLSGGRADVSSTAPDGRA
jgi:hypothetical protein